MTFKLAEEAHAASNRKQRLAGRLWPSLDERKEPVLRPWRSSSSTSASRSKSLDCPARPFLTAVDRRSTYLNLPSTAGQSLGGPAAFPVDDKSHLENASLYVPPPRFLEQARKPSRTLFRFSDQVHNVHRRKAFSRRYGFHKRSSTVSKHFLGSGVPYMKIEIISHLRRIQTRNNFHINRFDLVGVKKFVRRLNVVLLFSFFFLSLLEERCKYLDYSEEGREHVNPTMANRKLHQRCDAGWDNNRNCMCYGMSTGGRLARISLFHPDETRRRLSLSHIHHE